MGCDYIITREQVFIKQPNCAAITNYIIDYILTNIKVIDYAEYTFFITCRVTPLHSIYTRKKKIINSDPLRSVCPTEFPDANIFVSVRI